MLQFQRRFPDRADHIALEQYLIDTNDYDHQNRTQYTGSDSAVIHIPLLLPQGSYSLFKISIRQFQIAVKLFILRFQSIDLGNDILRAFTGRRQQRVLCIFRICPQSAFHLRNIYLAAVFQVIVHLIDVRKQLIITFVNIFHQMFMLFRVIRRQISIYVPLNLLIILLHVTSEHHRRKVYITDLVTLFNSASKIGYTVTEINSKHHNQCQVH